MMSSIALDKLCVILFTKGSQHFVDPWCHVPNNEIGKKSVFKNLNFHLMTQCISIQICITPEFVLRLSFIFEDYIQPISSGSLTDQWCTLLVAQMKTIFYLVQI